MAQTYLANYYTSTATTGNYNTTSTNVTSTNISSLNAITLNDNTNTIIIVNENGDFKIQPNSNLLMDDGTKIKVDDLGNFTILDKDAIVMYKGSKIREFNKYINASDLLESFIKDLGNLNTKQNEVLNVPIELFINWLIFNAAKQDGDNTPNNVPLLESSIKKHKHPKCLCCGKFIKKILIKHKIFFCNPEHHKLYIEKIGI